MTDCAVILMHLQNIVFMLFKLNDGLAFVTIFQDLFVSFVLHQSYFTFLQNIF